MIKFTVASVLNIVALASFAGLAVGCAGMTMPSSSMSAEQLTALAKDKSAGVTCQEAVGPWGRGRNTVVNVDKASIPSGTVTVDAECKVTITTGAAVKP